MDTEARQKMFQERVARLADGENGYAEAWNSLRARLLDLGPSWDVVPPLETDPWIDRILEDGCLVDAGHVRHVEGVPSRCHDNVLELVAGNLGGGERIAGVGTGYALSEDGLWRQHSWAFADDGAVVETTVSRVAYYGVRIDV